jgi:antitoxin component YwqK of YwqJK toxin-antitoxin module
MGDREPGTGNPLSFLCAAAILLPCAAALAQDDKHPGEEVIVVEKPDDCPKFGRIIARMLEAAPEGHKLRLTLAWVLDTNYGTSQMRCLKSAVQIDAAGRPDGMEESWSPSPGGRLERRVPYSKGIRQGIEQVWAAKDDRGARFVQAEIPWHNGKIHGTKKTYHPSGTLSAETQYANGRANGTIRSYDINGKLLRQGAMRDGKRHGTLTEYWTKTGKPRRIIPYTEGKVDGLVEEYYLNGKPKREMTFRKDIMHGVEKQYEADGSLARTRYWLDGEVVTEAEFERRSKP